MDDSILLWLLGINEELMEVCRSLNGQCDFDTASQLIPIADELTHVVAEIAMQKKGAGL